MAIKSAATLRSEAEDEQRRALDAARTFAQRAAAEWDADAVYLFGSRARNEWRRGSDVDLFVVSERFEGMSKYERSVELSRLWSGPVGCEAIGFTPQEWEVGRTRTGIVSMALNDGVLQLWPDEHLIRERWNRRE